ncbi:hypothetical protein [Pseudomonas sp. P9(2020)]|uniref:hypothetical protein n=1 Tax=Pseudomonas sp. P9(2020) TaxID=2763316 RepID=UPI001B32597F|nr:hypothetical protein [Pseudomonas sp. P9(2020)]MBP5948109.1 hypothetical protein [Pseudomonas sp. P9(2020)]
MNKIILLGLFVFPSAAFAFPIAVGVVGAGALGAVFWPVAVLAAALVWVWKQRSASAAVVAVTAIAAIVALLFQKDFVQEHVMSANLFNKADSSFVQPDVPFPFTDLTAQQKSRQGVTPAEFLSGLSQGHFKALKLSTYPSLFTQDGQISVEDLWRDKNKLIDAVQKAGGRVVLIDDFGGIAASVAEAAQRNFGLDLGFLVGGTTGLSRYGWSSLLEPNDPKLVPVESYKSWIEQQGMEVLSITTDREFVEDGWLYGSKTMTLGDAVSNLDSLIQLYKGKQLFLLAFETNDVGATPVLVQLLRSAGVDIHYVLPNEDEILVKEPYFKSYKNDDAIVSLDDAKRFLQHRPDVVFLDFGEKPLKGGVASFTNSYRFLSMQDVAAGKMPAFVASLDPTKAYVGLAFDRRTAYHSLLAGELISRNGGVWLGRFTQPTTLTDEFFNNEDLNSSAEHLVHTVKTAVAREGAKLFANLPVILLPILVMLLTVQGMLSFGKNKHVRASIYCLCTSAVFGVTALACADYPQLANTTGQLQVAMAAGLVLLLVGRRRLNRARIEAMSSYTPELPPKAEYLNEAAQLGYVVPAGCVLAQQDLHAWERGPFGRSQKLIVRSAAFNEASDHGATAGVFDSFIVKGAGEVSSLAIRVLESFRKAGVAGRVLVQPFIEAKYYGVAQFQDDSRAGFIVCEIGSSEAATGGNQSVERFEIPIWDLKSAPKHVRPVARALIKLAQLGATSIEFAISARNHLTLLQVNKDIFRACAVNRFADAADRKVQEVACAHIDPLSAGIVAALSPGNIFAFGNRRFCFVQSVMESKKQQKADLAKLGFISSKVEPEHLMAWLEEHAHLFSSAVDCSDDLGSMVEHVVAALQCAAGAAGRVNRIATTSLALGLADGAIVQRALPTSIIGAKVHSSDKPSWNGHDVQPLAGFNVYNPHPDFSADELASQHLPPSSAFHYIKDTCTALLMIRLGTLMPAITRIVVAGGAQRLLDALGTQCGYWDASVFRDQPQTHAQAPARLREFLKGNLPAKTSWRVPDSGFQGVVSTPDDPVIGGVLLLENCSMDHLPLIAGAGAIVALRGAITSHLMQHAAAKKLPVVIGGAIDPEIQPGDVVRVHASGRVCRA